MAIYKEDIVDIELESGTIHRSFLCHAIGLGDNQGNRFGVRLFRNGVAENVGSASVTGLFMAPNGTNYIISGSGNVWKSGNVAGVILPSGCYTVEGQFTLAIKLSLSGVVTTMRIIDGVVSNTGTTGAVVPSSNVPTSDQIIAAYQQAVAVIDSSVRYDVEQTKTAAQKTQARNNIEAAGLAQVVRVDADQSLTSTQKGKARTNINALDQNQIAPEFSEATAYPAGRYVMHSGALYRLTADHAANTTWANTSKSAVTVDGQLRYVLSQIAPVFNASTAYTAGQYVTYNGELYLLPNGSEAGSVWAGIPKTKTNIGSQLTDLKSAINSIYSDSISVTQGYWAIADGIPTNSAYWCKTNEFVDKKLILETNYKMFLLAFNKNTGAYIGTWDGTTFSTTYNSGSYLNYINVREWTNNYPNYQFKIDFQKPNSASVTPNDVYSNVSVKDVENDIDKNIEYISAKTNIIGNTLYNTFNPFVLWENGQLTNGKSANGIYNQRTSNFICVDGIDLSDVIISCDASGIFTYVSQYDASKNFLSTINRGGIGTISPTNPSTKYIKVYTYSETVSQDQQSSHITISFRNFDSNAKKIDANYTQSVIELTQSMVYENGEVGATGNSYDVYPSNNRTDRARAKKEYIQKIPDGATSFTVWFDEGVFASGRYKLGWAQYTSEYSQISATIKGWYTTKTSFTDNVNENAKYFMFYFATVSQNDTVDVATLPLDCCHVEFNNISIDYAKQLMYPSMITLYPQIDERISNLETNEALQTGGIPFVYSINHRGYSDEAPENTIPAYILSKKKGFSYAECDVQFTSDGVAVLLHDSTINRTGRNADGTSISSTIDIGDITYEQALTYDFGIWKGAIWAGTKIPTFEQFIVACKKLSIHPVIELKDVVNGTYWTDARIAVIANAIKKYGMNENVVFISFAKTALEKITAIFPNAMIGLGLEGDYTEQNFASYIQNATSLLSDNHIVAATVSYLNMTDALYTQLTNAGIHPIAWTVNTKSAVLGLNNSVIGILSDSINAGEVYLEDMYSQI